MQQPGPAVAADMNSSTLNAAKSQLRALMKQRLANISSDSVTSQSRYPTDCNVNKRG
jgi:hypothetical protein